jgi:peptidoglycan/LPS O-acetylase OafA/YrhL
MLVACFGLAILALSYKQVMLSGVLSIRVLVYLGEISYSVYLTHQIAQRVLKVVLHPDRFDGLSAFTRLMFFAIYLVAIVGVAMALFHLVEQPCRRYLRKISPFEKNYRRQP